MYVLLLLIVLLPAMQSVEPVPQKISPHPEAQGGHTQKSDGAPPAISSGHKPEQPETKREGTNTKDDSPGRVYLVDIRSLPFPPPDPLFRLYVCLTAVTAVIGLGTLIFVWRQSIHMRRQLNAFIESQRPQIAAGGYANPSDTLFEKTPRVLVAIHNTGLTTAYDCTYESWIEVLPAPFVDFTENADYFQSQNRFSLHSKHNPAVLNIPIRKGISQGEYAAINRNEMDVCIRVKVTYRDAFKGKRYANFGYMADAEGFRVLPKYHDSN